MQASDIAGTWQLALGPGSEKPLIATVVLTRAGSPQEDDNRKLEGKYTGVDPDKLFDVKDIAIEDNELRFTIASRSDDDSLIATYTVRPRGDKLSGKLVYDRNGDGGEHAVKGQRQ